jgi:hypothetical protein
MSVYSASVAVHLCQIQSHSLVGKQIHTAMDDLTDRLPDEVWVRIFGFTGGCLALRRTVYRVCADDGARSPLMTSSFLARGCAFRRARAINPTNRAARKGARSGRPSWLATCNVSRPGVET